MTSNLSKTRRLSFSAVVVFTLAVASLAPATAQSPGTVLLNVRSAFLTDGAGQSFGESDSKLAVFVADTNGDGVLHPTKDSFAPGSDDFVIGSLGTTFDAGGTAILGGINLSANTPLFTNGPTVETGDAFAMFWYPELSASDFSGVEIEDWDGFIPGVTAFGAYNTLDSTVDVSWVIPNPPSAQDFVLFSTDVPNIGTVDPLVLQASFTTSPPAVPEPSSLFLVLLGAGTFVVRRRR
jgi:hypothetical protein